MVSITPRLQLGQLEETAAVERKILNVFPRDNALDGVTLVVHLGGGSIDRHDLFSAAQAQSLQY